MTHAPRSIFLDLDGMVACRTRGQTRSRLVAIAMSLCLVAVGTGTAAERLAPRPERTSEERQQRAAELREIYAGDPAGWPAPHVDAAAAFQEIGLLPAVVHPEDNPYTDAKSALGRALFFDPRLSGSEQIACASCHDPDLGWADGRTTSFGHSRKMLARNAPSIRNTAFQKHLFWDGRADSLEDQAKQVLTNPDEMRSDAKHAVALLGMDLFRRDARCINCHNGPAFSDGGFHDLGLSNYGRPFEDLGRGKITNDPTDTGKFRTPSLRDATATQPLMHNGLFELPVALMLYNTGMPTPQRKESQADDPRFPVKSPLLKPLGLNKQDLADLTAFLTSLEEPKRRIRPPQIPGLHPGPGGPAARPAEAVTASGSPTP